MFWRKQEQERVQRESRPNLSQKINELERHLEREILYDLNLDEFTI
jgi:hypothetical protein